VKKFQRRKYRVMRRKISIHDKHLQEVLHNELENVNESWMK